MKTVRILGTAPNLSEMPPPPPGVEVWAANNPKAIRKHNARIILNAEWTRWFNLHSRAHMAWRYPDGLNWLLAQDGSKPFYTQKFWPDIPGCVLFPGPEIQETFKTSAGPNRYFTCSVCWLIAFAITQGFERIELWGFRLSNQKPGERYRFERPCFFYWVQMARDHGIEVWYQAEVSALPFEPGDPTTYAGPLYGYDTKPEC